MYAGFVSISSTASGSVDRISTEIGGTFDTQIDVSVVVTKCTVYPVSLDLNLEEQLVLALPTANSILRQTFPPMIEPSNDVF